MTSDHLRRLLKLETVLLPLAGAAALKSVTSDELEVALLTAATRARERGVDLNALRPGTETVVERIERGILVQAAFRSGPAFEKRREQVTAFRPQAAATYVPAVTPAGEVDVLDTPRLMSRRAALWSTPVVRAVLDREGLL